MSTHSDHLYTIALKLAKGIGSVTYKNCIDRFGHAKNVFCASPSQKTKLPKINVNFASLLAEEKTLLSAAKNLLERHKRQGVRVVAYGEEMYPTRLAQLHAPPSLLYCSLGAELDKHRVVSIVGTRQSTAYGKEVTKALVYQLKKYNPLIVSGLAYGIDIAAHKAALAYDIPTVAVMPGGHDMIYPSLHADIAEKLPQGGGGMLSEYSLGVKPSMHHFPARNRIIAGLSDATIVVEAPKKSGALITAYFAHECNREVFAVPGPIDAESSAGCHHLIKNHVAHLLTHIDDLAYVMNWSHDSSEKNNRKNESLAVALTTQEKVFVQVLHDSRKTVNMDMLSTALHLPLDTIASLALHLEMKGVIEVMGDSYRLKLT